MGDFQYQGSRSTCDCISGPGRILTAGVTTIRAASKNYKTN